MRRPRFGSRCVGPQSLVFECRLSLLSDSGYVDVQLCRMIRDGAARFVESNVMWQNQDENGNIKPFQEFDLAMSVADLRQLLSDEHMTLASAVLTGPTDSQNKFLYLFRQISGRELEDFLTEKDSTNAAMAVFDLFAYVLFPFAGLFRIVPDHNEERMDILEATQSDLSTRHDLERPGIMEKCFYLMLEGLYERFVVPKVLEALYSGDLDGTPVGRFPQQAKQIRSAFLFHGLCETANVSM